ncbi:MAG: energy-coupling factor transporter ATPase [Eggerthellaceae bacterium]|jgi:energy-coupling factor transport system ATP-binding protein|nr:energy-coupling factor transporter ATPase [Eggerthellaceae bacterium]MDR2722077.1 energy-coupling factor transporter ATPase [Coriobacteriaceae bacterium]
MTQTTTNAALINFEEVGFTYDGNTFVLDKVSLALEQGSFVCILGGNGSGKSTFAKHINALLVPDEGVVKVFDADTRDEENLYFIRSNAGMVFQNPDDQLVASLIENDVAFGPENLGLPTAELRERVTSSLAEVGLQGFEKNETHALSGGQKQRVAIAGVLAMNPSILVLDEASAMLDPRGRKGLLRVCQELNARGMTIVMITHFMEEASIADRVVVLENGRIALDGSPEEVLTQTEKLKDLNLEVPFACELSCELQQLGIPVSTHVLEDNLKEELCQLLLKA